MRAEDLHPVIREMLALHESFRRLNFTPDEIYVRPRTDDVHVTVKRGALEFNTFVGKHGMTVPELVRKWSIAAEWWNNEALEREREEIFRGSKVYAQSVDFVAAVVAKGFNVRKWDA